MNCRPHSSHTQVKLPDNPPWWDLFGTELTEIKRVCNAILSLYHQEPVQWLEPLHPNSLVSKEVLEKFEGGGAKKEAANATPAPVTAGREAVDLTGSEAIKHHKKVRDRLTLESSPFLLWESC